MGKPANTKSSSDPRPRFPAGLSLAKFAKAKTAGYDKRREIERKRALQAKKINKFRKIRDRLKKEGKLKPAVDYDQLQEELGEDEVSGGHKLENPRGQQRLAAGSSGDVSSSQEEDDRSEEGAADLDLRRIRARAGPAPSDDDDTDGGSYGIDMSGDDEEEDEEGDEKEEGKPLPSTRDWRGEKPGRSLPEAYPDRLTAAHPAVRGHAPEAEREGMLQAKAAHGQQGVDVELHVADRNPGQKGASTAGPAGGRKDRRKKPISRIERLAARAQAEKEAQRRAREEARRAAEVHRARVAQVEAARKEKSNMFRKKTRTGQPVMKFRIEGLLGKVGTDNALFKH